MIQQLSDRQHRVQAETGRFQRFLRPGLAVNQHDHILDDQPDGGQLFDGFEFRASGCSQVVNHDDHLPGFIRALDLGLRSVGFGFLARVDHREIAPQRDGGRDGNGGEGQAGNAVESQVVQDREIGGRDLRQQFRVRDDLPQVNVDRGFQSGFQVELTEFDAASREESIGERRETFVELCHG